MKQLPDYLQIWPGHGAGSACGKALGAVPSTTLGYEKLFNPAFQFSDEASFVTWLLDGQPEAPKYFAQMKKINKIGSPLLSELDVPQHITELSGDKLVIDTRSTQQFAAQHIAGTINIPANSNSFSTYAGWYVDFNQPIELIVYPEQLDSVLSSLRAVGVDLISGYATPDIVEGHQGSVTQMTPQEVYDAGIKILDVRGIGEYNDGHIPNADHIHMGRVPDNLERITRDEQLAVQCGGGLRSQVVVSILQKHGYDNVINMSGGIGAWKEAGLPIES
jgi:hydroxyacylglutathione hydrolase